jgi:outer membrane protein
MLSIHCTRSDHDCSSVTGKLTGWWPRTLSTAVVLLAMLASPVLAQSQVKVGFVNVPRVLDQAPQAQDARARIEREFAPRDRELLDEQKEIRGLEDQLIRDGDVMTEAERVRLEQEIRQRKRDLRRSQDEFREDLNLRRSQELSDLQREVIQVIQSIAQDEKYDLIVSDGVIFAGARVDITDTIIARLKAEFKQNE